MSKLKKVFAIILALSILLLAGCGNSSKDPSATDSNEPSATGSTEPSESVTKNEPVTITHWFWPDNEEYAAVFKGIADEFNATNGKNITVVVENHPWDGGKFSEDLFTAAMGGSAPDTAGFKLTATPLFAANNLLVPLDDYIDKWEDKALISENLLKVLRSATSDNKLYTMPWVTQILYVYYRPSMFDAVGIAVPKTYEEFLEACKKLTRDTDGDGKIDVYGYGMRGSKGGQEPWGSFIHARGGNFENLTSEGAIQGMQDFTDLYKNGYTPPSAPNDGYNEIIANFKSGLTAMTIQHIQTASGMVSVFGDDVSAFAFPDSDKGRWTSMGDTETVIFNSSKNKEAAFEWVSYLATGKGQKTWCDATGNIPVSSEVQELPSTQENRFMKVSIEGAPFAGILPILDTTTNWISSIWPATVQRALLGEITAAEAMKILQDELYK